MKNKTRILVTHQLHVLSQADFVVVMKDGRIVEQGTYHELMANGDAFSELIKLYVGEEEKAAEDGHVPALSASQEAIDHKTDMDRLGLLLTKKKDARNLMSVEERAVGTVDAKVWISYFRASGGSTFGLILFVALIFVQIMRVGNDFWLVIWVNNTIPTFSSGQYIAVFWAWSMGQAISIYLLGVFFATTGVLAAKRLHQAAINRVIKAPMGFFDTSPLGRIINRFSKDLDGIDNSLSEAFRIFSLTLANGIATFVLIIYATPLFVAALVPVGVLYYFVQLIYRNTSGELKRLDSISRSPYYAHFGESLSGLPTIRAYRVQDRFISDNARFLDTNSGAYYHLLTAQRWLGVRLETLGSFLVLFAAIFGVISRQSPQLSAALIGLSLTYALQVTGTLNWCVRQFTETEIAMNAVERMHHYGTTSEIEADAIVDAHRPPKEWPSQGVIDVRNLQMKYAPDLPIILKGISFKTTPREKIGVVCISVPPVI